MRRRCYCHACRARDERRFWRIVAPLQTAGVGSTPRLGLPPIPVWDGEPGEIRVTRKGN